MVDDLKARLKKGFEKGWAVDGDREAFNDVYTPDIFIHHNPFRDIVGIEDLKNGVSLLKTVFPDQYVIIDEMLFEEDKGIGHYSCYFTHPVTGAPIVFRGISFTYMEDGKVTEEVSYDDNLSFFLQLGLFRFGVPMRISNYIARQFFPISLKGPSALINKASEADPPRGIGAKITHSLQAAYNKGDLDALEEIYAPDCVIHNSPYADVNGLEELKRYVAAIRTAFPDLAMRVDDTMSEGDEGGYIHTFGGTNTGFIGFFPPTRKEARWRGVVRISLKEGKIGEEFIYDDYAGLMLRLGLIREGSLPNLIGIANARGPIKMAKFIYKAGFEGSKAAGRVAHAG